MSFLAQLETRFRSWQGKRGAKKTLASLVDSIASINQLLETSGSAYCSVARQHSDSADRDYHAAIRAFKSNDFVRCYEFLDRAKLHLEIAHTQIIHAGEGDWELHFDENSVESIVAHLAQSLTSAKLAIEYSNCIVRQQVHTALITVTKFFQKSIEYLLDNDYVRAKRTTHGGLLYLYCISLQLGVDNQCTIFEVHVPHCSGLERSILDLAEQMAACQHQFLSASMAVPAAARSHFAEAESTLCEAVNAIVEGMVNEADSAIAAALLQVKLAEKLFQASDGSKVEEKNPLPTMVGSVEFRAVVKDLCQIIPTMKYRQPGAVEKHLRIALTHYESACAEFVAGNLSEADFLARQAYVELDSAKKGAWFLNI
jgi:cellobiose-specific phosphotransferase system component IIA